MIETILNKMTSMKLYGMSESLQTLIQTGNHQSLTNDEFLNLLIQAEWEDREHRKIKRLVRNAHFRYQASIEQINFHHQRNLDKTLMMRLADCSFIDRKENLLLTGSTGVGKSFIASALGHQACLKGYKTLYFNTQKLFPKLKMSKADGSYIKEIDKIERHDLIILDDFGLQPFDNQKRMMLLEIIEDRHGSKSTIIASQLPVAKWYDIIGESTVADAILDRMIHTAHRIELKGDSLRIKQKTK